MSDTNTQEKDKAAQPLRLQVDNFTPPSRTPWGGHHIVAHYKAPLASTREATVVGESWEFSVAPDFPSHLHDSDATLADQIAADPEGMLGMAALQRFGASTPLLLKLIDAKDNLSLQIHPPETYPGLASGESGKHECWFVLDAAPGAGLYLGFRRDVSAAQVQSALAAGTDLRSLLFFVPVRSGDLFVIAPGTPHAIGAGVFLLEPQLVTPGKRGVTYRYWDWNRRYNAAGQADPEGHARPLHVAQAREVTCWDREREADFLRRWHCHTPIASEGSLQVQRLLGPGTGARLAAPEIELWLLQGSGTVALPPPPTLAAWHVIDGQVCWQAASKQELRMQARRGETWAVPATTQPGTLQLNKAAMFCAWPGLTQLPPWQPRLT